jgi:hypothetical protein
MDVWWSVWMCGGVYGCVVECVDVWWRDFLTLISVSSKAVKKS